MKTLLTILFSAMTTIALTQNQEENIKKNLEAEANALIAGKPDLVRSFWKYDTVSTESILNVSLADGFFFNFSGKDFAKDSNFPPPQNITIKNTDYKIRINGNLAVANYKVIHTKADGKVDHSNRIDILEKNGNDWKIVTVSQHYYLQK
ncbi:MAG: nuclear transport factor 2 family protein [Bacteroidota bacterium]